MNEAFNIYSIISIFGGSIIKMNLTDFIAEVQDKVIDYSLGYLITYHKRKKLVISNVDWTSISETLSLKIFLCTDQSYKPKNILQIYQNLKIIDDSLIKLEKMKKRVISNEVYIKTNFKEILIRKVRRREGNLILE